MKTMILMAMTVATVAAAQGKDLRGAYLYSAQLERVDFRGANLEKTQLGHANLRQADLRGAKLAGAYLYQADLSGADLRGAQFKSRFELHKVTLTGARFDSTTALPFSDSEAYSRHGEGRDGREPRAAGAEREPAAGPGRRLALTCPRAEPPRPSRRLRRPCSSLVVSARSAPCVRLAIRTRRERVFRESFIGRKPSFVGRGGARP